jgi:hypothetical protein
MAVRDNRFTGAGTTFDDVSILRRLPTAGRLKPGELPKKTLTFKAAEASRVLKQVIRFVADVPADTSPIVVWTEGGSELWVDISTVTLDAAPGLLRVSLKVGCDQLREAAAITVPFGVGTEEAPTGLVMSSLDRLDGPEIVTERWTPALTAFAWEAVLELASRLCAQLGTDGSGHALIPGSIGAGASTLLIQPMSRNDLSRLGRSS